VLVVSSIIVCTVAAGAIAWARTPTYEATAQLFVSAKGSIPEGAGGAFEGGLYAQQRARSYARVISSAHGAQTVIEELGLSESVDAVEERIRVSAPPDSQVINVAARDSSPRLAKSIANSLAGEVPRLADELESPEGSPLSPVEVTVTRPARLDPGAAAARKPIYLAMGALFGLGFGVAGAVLRDALERRVRSQADVRVTVGAPVLARISEHPDPATSPVMLGDPLSDGAEDYRRLQANLRALTAEHHLRSLVVSSAVAGEGKTHVVANLGVALAESGQRVVLVEANLRSPRLGDLLGVRSSIGLTDLLAARPPIELALRRHPTAPLEVLTGGSPPPNPSELLDSDVLDWVLRVLTDRFDFVLVDTPALLAVGDAAVVARHASAVLLVARAASTTGEELRAVRQALRAVDRRVLGLVLNRVRERDRILYAEDPLPPPVAG
jgi:capsular exopolysaccharide synthesis family protein